MDRADDIGGIDPILFEAQDEYDYANLNDEINEKREDYVRLIDLRSIQNIEGATYQFFSTVDRRINMEEDKTMKTKSLENRYLGSNNLEKIVTQMPLLFLSPCNPLFVDDKTWTSSDKSVITTSFSGITGDIESLLQGSGKFYYASYVYQQYYNYLNVMQ